MGSRSRSWWSKCGPGLVLLVTILVTFVCFAAGALGAEKAQVLGLPVGVAGLWMAWRFRARPDLDEEARNLGRKVARDRRKFLTQALGPRAPEFRGARLRFADPAAGEVSPAVEEMLLRWRAQGDLPLSGDQHNLAALYRDVVAGRSGRLVVLGEPGAGKTVMLSFLVVDLIPGSPEGEVPKGSRVPVMFSLPSCDLGQDALTVGSEVLAERWREWMTSRLVADWRLSAKLAKALLQDGRVLPVLDGLDEMDPSPAGRGGPTDPVVLRPRAAAVLRALNTHHGEPVVLACRRLEYWRITPTRPGDSGPRMLSGQHVMMQPLTPAAVLDFLTRHFSQPSPQTSAHGTRVQDRWEPVCERLRRAQALQAAGRPASQWPVIARVLESPWRMFLATKVFADAGSDPGVLLGMTAGQVNEFLLDELIPHVVAQAKSDDPCGWELQEVNTWLTGIAVHQRNRAQQGWSETDIYLPGLWSLGGRRWPRLAFRLVAALPFAVGGAAALTVASHSLTGYLAGGILFCLAGYVGWVASPDIQKPLESLDLGALRSAAGRRRLSGGLRFGLVSGLGFGLVPVLVIGLSQGVMSAPLIGLAITLALALAVALVMGLAIGLARGITSGLMEEMRTINAPSQLVRQSVKHSLVSGLVEGLVFGLAVGLVLGLAGGLADGLGFRSMLALVIGLAGGLVFGLVLGLVLGLAGQVLWMRYALGTWGACRRGLLPSKPARFLDWCVKFGLMRMSGNNLQFRHRELQDHLVASSRRVRGLR